ncbi:MAG: SGNH/GDSL hydrolase family protein [Kiritimatiellia bacterium]|jgi:lysophospholipase L1-like esterase|nr:SGNH/GDSL hydrolase family protein [Kiritimatiellia bacterium]
MKRTLATFLLAALSAMTGCVHLKKASVPRSLNIVFIGDSITYGYLLKQPESEAPPAHAAEFLKGKPGIASVRFANCGRNGFRADQFLPGRPNSAWPQVKQAADAFINLPGTLVFSLMVGANDSVSVTPAQYGKNLSALVGALSENYPRARIFIHHPLWYSKVPSTRPEVLATYLPVIDALVGTLRRERFVPVQVGDVSGWAYFEKNHESVCFRETRDHLPYYIHPNGQGAIALGQYWGEALYRGLVPQPPDL